jgi:FKBP-type peptidyl-prolyl cis-trans isomerase
MRRIALALLLLVPLAACDSPTEPRIEETRFAGHLGVDLDAMTRLPSGVYIRDHVVGQGALVETGKSISVQYRGWLADGTLFDQRIAGQPPFAFTLGAGQVIAGWEIGVQGMRVGGRRQLVIPPGLAYGRDGRGSIPGNAILVFEVTVMGVQ